MPHFDEFLTAWRQGATQVPRVVVEPSSLVAADAHGQGEVATGVVLPR